MKEIVLKIVCYVAVLASVALWPAHSQGPTTLALPTSTTFNPMVGTPCEGVRCPSGRRCAVDENNQASCVCDGNCNDTFYSPVCGSDNRTYYNYCAVSQKACKTNSNLTVSYYAECRYESSICNGITCPLNRVCAVAGNRAVCVCPDNCPTYSSLPVCGSDNQTYFNDCVFRRHACLTNKNTTIKYYGDCHQAPVCDGFSCPNGTQCAIGKRPVCVCLDTCPYSTDVICGTDGQAYGSECDLYRQACKSASNIRMAYKGYCLNGSVCSGYRCPKNRQCNVNQNNEPVCVCSQSCPSDDDPVCGSDGNTYPNLCFLERQACITDTNITMVRKGQCSYDAYCYGVVCPTPKICVVNERNQTSCVCNNNCGNFYSPVCGSDNKTYDNYCQFNYVACETNISANFNNGVCPIGSGCQGISCPFGQHCDSLHHQQPKCVCDTICPKTYSPVCSSNNKTYNNSCELQKDACLTNTSISTNFDGKCPGCTYTSCPYGQTCKVDERNRPMCVCSQDCAAGSNEVCGSDGKTYSNDCFLGAAACLTNKTISVLSFERCIKDGPCNGVDCSSDRNCEVGQNGRPICVCNDQCDNIGSPVCGSDNKTYDSLCELEKKACVSSTSIRWLYYGACVDVSACDKISCSPDKRCAIDERNRTTCVCIDQCLGGQDWVCGSDGHTYNNECEMRKSACLSNRNVTMKYRGKCDKGPTCSDITCSIGRVCALNEKNQTTCVCNTVCYFGDYSVCGSDGRTYASQCFLQREACTKNKNIQVAYYSSCRNDTSSTTTGTLCVGPFCTTRTTTLIP